MTCPNCKGSMSYQFTKGNSEIYKCGRCGCGTSRVKSNTQRALKGTYITNEGINIIDKRR